MLYLIYVDPENRERLLRAVQTLVESAADINDPDSEDAMILKDLKSVSRQYNVPYNTLRDNFLK